MHAFAPTGRLASMADDTNYGSLGALAPNWDEGERNIDTDEIYERFFTWVEDVKGVEPWPHQEEAIMDLLAGDHVILNTPTGSGKSLVALGMHFAALCTGRRSYYTAPIKALVSEKFFDLVEVFGRENVGMITGDTHINADAPIICCTAEILANQALREGRHADVGCVAMDEFHYYGDPERGWAWQVPLLTLPDTQFLLMSATLGNVDAIADKLEDMTDTDVDIIADAPRPVPLTYEYTLDPLEKTVELAFGKGETPIYVVHFSQDAALETANALASTGVSSKEQRAAIAEAIKGTKFTTAFGKILQRLLRTGIGIHHAGMLPRYRRLVEQLAQQGLLPVEEVQCLPLCPAAIRHGAIVVGTARHIQDRVAGYHCRSLTSPAVFVDPGAFDQIIGQPVGDGALTRFVAGKLGGNLHGNQSQQAEGEHHGRNHHLQQAESPRVSMVQWFHRLVPASIVDGIPEPGGTPGAILVDGENDAVAV